LELGTGTRGSTSELLVLLGDVYCDQGDAEGDADHARALGVPRVSEGKEHRGERRLGNNAPAKSAVAAIAKAPRSTKTFWSKLSART
jgi:hypothetical protein